MSVRICELLLGGDWVSPEAVDRITITPALLEKRYPVGLLFNVKGEYGELTFEVIFTRASGGKVRNSCH